MLQITRAFPAIFFQPCQNDLEFNSREGVSFTGAVRRVPSWGRLEKSFERGADLYFRMVLLWRRRLANKAGRQSLVNKLTGKAHSEFEKWLLAGDENQSRFVR
jgi:hypothetical protein